MIAVPSAAAGATRLERLLGFLETDPGNGRLLADAAGAALDEGKPETALDLIERVPEAEMSPHLANLQGLAALEVGRLDEAEAALEQALAGGVGGPEVRFNLAVAKARKGDYEAAAALLDGEVAMLGPQAALLRLQVLHHAGRIDDALAEGRELAQAYPEYEPLFAALAELALDAEDMELARDCADRAQGTAAGAAARGMLLMAEDRPDEALTAFDRALAGRPDAPRALLGRGLALVARGDSRAAAEPLDLAAEAFGDHPGSWIAAGWARYLANDLAAARARFERALASDQNFAESHGALAVVDAAEGKLDAARRGAEVAQRLDPACFSAALARSMLLEADGDGRGAEALRRRAMAAPAGPGGRTIAQALAATAGRR